MKTDVKISQMALCAFLGTFVAASAAQAQPVSAQVDFNAPAATRAASSGEAVAPTSAGTAVSVSPAGVSVSTSGEQTVQAAIKTASGGNAPKSKEAVAEDKDEDDGTSSLSGVPDSVKGVVKKLNKATKDVTIDDLNSAREAIVKLDVLIDIEKRLNDLSTLRVEREEKMGGGISESSSDPMGIVVGGRMPTPANMAPPPALSPASQPVPASTPAAITIERDISVVKVVGASGRYVATITDLDGSSKQVRAGDKLSNGAIVDSISKRGVTVVQPDKKKNTIQVKDIGTVFGG